MPQLLNSINDIAITEMTAGEVVDAILDADPRTAVRMRALAMMGSDITIERRWIITMPSHIAAQVLERRERKGS